MKMLKNIFLKFFNFFFQVSVQKEFSVQMHQLNARFLQRKVFLNVYLPPNYLEKKSTFYPIIFFNDGQDMKLLQMEQTLNQLLQQKKIRPVIVVAIHAGNRMHEYGPVLLKDYKNRGHLSEYYQNFIMENLIPFIQQQYRVSSKTQDHILAGFSLSGLSAMETVWRHPHYFGKVGVFSGSFWWRFQAFQEDNPDADRAMHHIIAHSKHRKGMKFWLQTGTKDETDDRNNNGIIDSIDDTKDLILELKKLGYKAEKDIQYIEIINGEHNQKTWGAIMPDFLIWAIGAKRFWFF